MSVRPVFVHPWDVSPGKARQIQDQLRERVLVQPFSEQPECVAGVDVSVKEGLARAAVVLLSYPDLIPVEAATAEEAATFPYVPGLLAFREGPVVLRALERLRRHPDVLIFDAQGLAHPRRMGLATHLGVLLDLPAVGCAKSRLCGTHQDPGEEKGQWTVLEDKGDVIGAVVRTRTRVKPVYVSAGHRVDLHSSVSLVVSCTTRYRLPETTRWAHRVAGGGTLHRS
jgi:deoxyribonuclease V